jgi:hypothetical protein
MCVVAAKYFDGYGWIIAKNRDRNYRADISVIKSKRNGIERIYIKDDLSYWTEGLNEYGVSILSAALSVDADEQEVNTQPQNTKKNKDGKIIRDALYSKTAEEATEFLIERRLCGHTIIADDKNCYVLESSYTEFDRGGQYKFDLVKLKRTDTCVRTNHGINLEFAGYLKPDEDTIDTLKAKRNYESSHSRLKIAQKGVDKAEWPEDMFTALSQVESSDPFMNPIRSGNVDKKDMVTTGQILLDPRERTLHYKPIVSNIVVKYDKLNGPDAKTFFEIISSKTLLSFKEWDESQH